MIDFLPLWNLYAKLYEAFEIQVWKKIHNHKLIVNNLVFFYSFNLFYHTKIKKYY